MAWEKKPRVGILGAGLMGHGLAQVFAVKGCDVTMFDRDAGALAGALARVRRNLDVFLELGIVTANEVEQGLNRISLARDLADMCAGRDFIIEAVSENLELKRRLFAEMESHVPPGTILASNTSAIRISSIAEGLAHPERVVGTHFWNPPHIVPCVEVIKAEHTSAAVFEAAQDLLRAVGKEPVRVWKDIPGFLGNRMQHALWREAIKLVESGVADAEDVDKVVRNSFGLRLAFLGPLETADLAGLDLTCEIQQDLLQHLDNSREPSPLLRDKIARGEKGAKSGRGFHSWPPEKLRRLLERRDKVLLRILREVNAE
ncbi:MAG: 3-hydroxyacyl-CoA dehydrogenase NAD-binding domain-containing protein [Pseudomonadota bacterium]